MMENPECPVNKEHKVIQYSTCKGGYTYCTKCAKYVHFNL